jgi:amino acid transporter
MTQNKRTNIANILVIVGMILMIVMAVTPLLVNHQLNMEWMRWIFIAGALIVLVGRLIDIYRGPSLRLKRLHVILVFSALLYCASGSMMFIFQGTNNWIAFLLAGVMVQLYASWMIDREQSKNKQ